MLFSGSQKVFVFFIDGKNIQNFERLQKNNHQITKHKHRRRLFRSDVETRFFLEPTGEKIQTFSTTRSRVINTGGKTFSQVVNVNQSISNLAWMLSDYDTVTSVEVFLRFIKWPRCASALLRFGKNNLVCWITKTSSIG